MEEIFSYSQYDQVLSLHFSDDESFIIFQSSNRLIMALKVKKVEINTIFVKDDLLEFFKLQLISENQQTGDEKIRYLSIINSMKELKQDIIQKNISMFDKSQIIFCLPAEWTEDKYENDLRALFLKAGWINREDHKNRLIFSTFVERSVHFLQMDKYNDVKFERERKYLLFSMDETSFRLTYYQMQSAKELIAVSKKLAVSDFLLTPTVLDDEPICLPDLGEIIYNTIERMLTQRQNANNTAPEVLHRLTDVIFECLNDIYHDAKQGFDRILHTTLNYYMTEEYDDTTEEYLIALGMNCSTLIHNILNDTDIKQLMHKVSDTFKRILSKYSQVENSPDGVQAIILCNGSSNSSLLYKDLVLDAMLNAKITNTKNEFIDLFDTTSATEAAMKKSYKMIQLANALSPPDILSKDKLSLYPNLFEHGWHENDLLQPNSFYVQAYIYENHINFILNKVVAVSSIDNAVQKSTFTIQERSINVENIIEEICDIMWNHFQALDFEDYGNRVFRNCCDEHGIGEFNAENYFNFKTNLKIFMSNWFQDEYNLTFEELDIYHSISTNINCKCALNITYRMLIVIALRQAINNIATVITSTLASNDLFGLYDVSALIIISESKNTALNTFSSILNEATHKRLQVHQKRPVVFYGEKELVACKLLGSWVDDVKQILGIGSYLQVSSTSYTVTVNAEFEVDGGPIRKKKEIDDWPDCSSKFYEVSQIELPVNSYILKKDDCLHQGGVIRRLMIKNSDYFDIFMLSSSQTGEFPRLIIRFLSPSNEQSKYPITIKVLSQHYSSTVKIEVSYVEDDPYLFFCSESFIIHEKLVLKQK